MHHALPECGPVLKAIRIQGPCRLFAIFVMLGLSMHYGYQIYESDDSQQQEPHYEEFRGTPAKSESGPDRLIRVHIPDDRPI
jgi:hypothetical protein